GGWFSAGATLTFGAVLTFGAAGLRGFAFLGAAFFADFFANFFADFFATARFFLRAGAAFFAFFPFFAFDFFAFFAMISLPIVAARISARSSSHASRPTMLLPL